ncbi:MAG: FG-GAP repeat protein [Deltaproteobacteria bacterium]|nr:FG-GAP repeat protein [Deltaproteobacteria bacterium]
MKKLAASDAVSSQYFGASVAVGEDLTVVGADDDGGNTGAAYAFRRGLGGSSHFRCAGSVRVRAPPPCPAPVSRSTGTPRNT